MTSESSAAIKAARAFASLGLRIRSPVQHRWQMGRDASEIPRAATAGRTLFCPPVQTRADKIFLGIFRALE